EQRIVLRDVSWETYERLLKDFEGRSSPRMAYDQGMLEIMSPSSYHEKSNRTLAQFVEVLAEELDIDLENLGSTTYKRNDLLKGFEPDSSFYIQNAETIHGKTEIDFLIDPPPDLVIEVDITHDSLNKFSIYAAFGIPEVWRCDGPKVAVFLLQDKKYVESRQSLAFPGLTGGALSSFLADSKKMKRTEWLRKLRGWIRGQDWSGKGPKARQS
ncbi:MAG: Uma2 family endonuclease, partial [Planctomycetes bacterium]|nr:Uma2 family endonuclease [Planctomycetota bacterium]